MNLMVSKVLDLKHKLIYTLLLIRDSQKDDKLDRVINNVPKDKINIDLTNLDIISICIKSIIEDNF